MVLGIQKELNLNECTGVEMELGGVISAVI